eukprot:6057373-Amphidinium_carterae.2
MLEALTVQWSYSEDVLLADEVSSGDGYRSKRPAVPPMSGRVSATPVETRFSTEKLLALFTPYAFASLSAAAAGGSAANGVARFELALPQLFGVATYHCTGDEPCLLLRGWPLTSTSWNESISPPSTLPLTLPHILFPAEVMPLVLHHAAVDVIEVPPHDWQLLDNTGNPHRRNPKRIYQDALGDTFPMLLRLKTRSGKAASLAVTYLGNRASAFGCMPIAVCASTPLG